MMRLEFKVHEMGRGEAANKITIRGRDMRLDEGVESRVVAFPDEGRIGSDSDVRAG
jgi:hypothetical protein